MSRRRYTTVNGIKLKLPVDETTRKKIERAGDTTQQMMKAAELGVLDDRHYLKVVTILKRIAKDFW